MGFQARAEDVSGKQEGDHFSTAVGGGELKADTPSLKPVDGLGRITLTEDRLPLENADQTMVGPVQSRRFNAHDASPWCGRPPPGGRPKLMLRSGTTPS